MCVCVVLYVVFTEEKREKRRGMVVETIREALLVEIHEGRRASVRSHE